MSTHGIAVKRSHTRLVTIDIYSRATRSTILNIGSDRTTTITPSNSDFCCCDCYIFSCYLIEANTNNKSNQCYERTNKNEIHFDYFDFLIFFIFFKLFSFLFIVFIIKNSTRINFNYITNLEK